MNATPALTPRQWDVLKLTACGLSWWEIEARLGIAQRTTHRARRAVYEALGARNAPHAVAIALTAGVLSRDEMADALEANTEAIRG